ncbi:serine hydrolase [Leifsonia kafniensis]|uniref:Serine hydrolase n=1 Tax=Leifsonia kafniensis TaxID=475957 RepID=A0ABP7K343_9MICO
MSVISAYSDGVPFLSFLAMNADGHVLISLNADEPVYAASTIKLAVLVAAMRQVDAGMLSLDQPVAVTDTFMSRIAGAGRFSFEPDETDLGLPPNGETVSLAECLERMIRVSSNAATNLVVERIGMPAVTESLALMGAGSSSFERLISDHAARDEGFSHAATAHDLAAIMNSIVTGALCGPASTAFMVEQLKNQAYPVIGAALPPGATWGSKSGWVDGIHHDVAFVGEPGEPDSYVLAVCTRGFGNEHAQAVIAAVARGVQLSH